MNKSLLLTLLAILYLFPSDINAQINESKNGAWYMYFFNAKIKESSWGLTGDVQYRNWDAGGDLEQLLIRGGLTYKPKNANIKFTLGWGNVNTGAYGPDKSTSLENRIYQEALFPTKIGKRVYLNHRFRYEQRFVEGQDFRSRYRYNLFLTVPLNNSKLDPKTVYLAFYNELFINGERNIGNFRTVEIFDRNRSYAAIGYVFNKNIKVQLGAMHQITDKWEKSQAQLSLHHDFGL